MAPDSEPKPRVPWLPVTEGAQPPAPTTPEQLTPTKPTVPAWIQRDAVPEPVEAEEGDVVAPFAPPAAEEVLPRPVAEPAVPAEPSSPPPPALWNSDPVQMLGESAVASAALSAAGAPTPLGGVPTVAPEEAVTPPSFGSDAPLFTPKFDTPAPPSEQTSSEKADALAAGVVAEEQSRLAAQTETLEAGSAYTPLNFAEDAPTEPLPTMPRETVMAPVPPTTASGDGTAGDGTAGERKPRRWWLWVLLGLLAVGGAATVYAFLNPPEPEVQPGTVITQSPPAATITPIAAPTATSFQAAMPTIVGTYSLVEATPLEPADIALTAGRVADGVDLVYRSGDSTIKVRALQYFNEDDATQMFGEFVGEGASTRPVEAGGAVVGDSAFVAEPVPALVWRNGTSVFIATGKLPEVASFFEDFGL